SSPMRSSAAIRWRRSRRRQSSPPRGAHHWVSKPAVMLLLAIGVPTSLSVVVTLNLSNSFCSALMRLWVMLSAFELLAPAPNVVPVGTMLNLTSRSLLQIELGVDTAPVVEGVAGVASLMA